jgi:integrase
LADLAAAFEMVAGRPGTLVDIGRFAPATLASYAYVLNRFTRWLAARDKALPVDARTVIAWLEEQAAAGLAPSTIRRCAAAISTAHQLREAPFDWRSLKGALHKIDRLAWHVPRQARPLLAEELKAIVASLVPTRFIDARDGALLTLGWAAMLRRGELVGLDWHRLGDGSGFARLHAGGILVGLAKSKTRQHAAERILIGPADMPAAISALEAWARLAKLRPGEPIFCAVDGRGIGERLAGQDVSRIVKRRVHALAIASGRAAEADELAALSSGHSLRAGAITAMALAKVPEHEIRKRSRHTSAEMVARYVRAAAQWKDSGLAAVGF